MKASGKLCRLCLTEDDFNTPLYGKFCRRNNIAEKVQTCLSITVKETDSLNTICYKCVENIQNFYAFITSVKESQYKFVQPTQSCPKVITASRHVRSYVQKQVYDMDYSFSFLDGPSGGGKEVKSSSLFSYMSPSNVVKRKRSDETSHIPPPKAQRRGQISRDLFDSQSLDLEEEPKSQETIAPNNNNIINKIRNICFKRSDF